MKNRGLSFVLTLFRSLSRSILYLSLLLACAEDESATMTYPLIQTGEVTQITVAGATFNAKVVHPGSEVVLDQGFVWSKVNMLPTIGEGYKKSASPDAEGFLVATINSSLQDSIQYAVRAYILTENYISYGNQIVFKSLGSMAPVIESFTPEIASWEDTVILLGNNFSFKEEDQQVKFGKYEATLLSSHDTSVTVLVPTYLDTASTRISISVLGNVSYSQKNFTLSPPIINKVTPNEGIHRTMVEITGKYFFPERTIVFFNNIQAKILAVNDAVITVQVPEGLPSGEIQLSANVLGQVTQASQPFISLTPIIKSFYPKTGTFLDTLTVLGNNFGNSIEDVAVNFGFTKATVVSITKDELKVLVPPELATRRSQIMVKVKGQTVYAEGVFEINLPIITDFYPKEGAYKDTITIYGKNFNPIPYQNVIKFSSSRAYAIEAYPDSLIIHAPNSIDVSPASVYILFDGNPIAASGKFTFLPPFIIEFDPVISNVGKTVTIAGSNFSPNAESNKVYFGDVMANVTASATNINNNSALFVTVPTGVTKPVPIRVEVGGQSVVSASKFTMNWSQISHFKGNGLTGAIAFGIGNKGYVGTGKNSDSFWQFDAESEIWKQLSSIGGGGKENAVAFTIGNKGYICLGYSQNGYENRLWEYDPATDSWLQKADFPGPPRDRAVAFTLQDKAYVGSGYSTTGTDTKSIDSIYYNDFWKYNAEQDMWSRIADLPAPPRADAFAFSVQNRGFVGGGIDENEELISDFWEYIPANDHWVKKSNYNGIAARNCTAFSLSDKGYVTSGLFSVSINRVPHWRSTREVWEYDPITDAWISKIDFQGLPRNNAIAFVIDDHAYIGTGEIFYPPATIDYFDDFWQYYPED